MNNHFKILIGFVIMLAALTYYVVYSEKSAYENNESNWFVPILQEEGVVNELNAIEIVKGEERVDLMKQGNVWFIKNGFYADTAPMMQLINALMSAKKIEAKTNNPANHTRLELDASNGLKVTLLAQDRTIASLYLGKKGNSQGTAFARLDGDDQSWLVTDIDQVNFMKDDWQLKTIFNYSPDDIVRVEIDNGKEDPIIVERNVESGLLTVVNVKEGQQLKVDVHASQFAGGLSRFTIDEALPLNLEKESAVITANYQLTNGQDVTVTLYQKDGEDVFWATVNIEKYKDWMFKVPKYKFDALNKSLAEFVEPIVNEDSEHAE